MAATTILDDALHDFDHEHNQRHITIDQDIDSTFNHPNTHIDSNPHPTNDDEFHSFTIKERIDSYFLAATITLDYALHDFDHGSTQSHITTDQDIASTLNHPNKHTDSNSHPPDTPLILNDISDNPYHSTAQHPMQPQRRITRSMTTAIQQRLTTPLTPDISSADSSSTSESDANISFDFSDSDDFHNPSNPTCDDHDINDLSAPIHVNHNTNPPSLQFEPNSNSHITSHPTLSCQLDISTFATQNTHGLRRLPRDSEGKLITNTPYDYTRYEHLITMMKTKNLDVYFIQETWLEDDAFDEIINDYHVFRHNGGKGNHNFRGVAIILSPRYYDGWKAAGARPPLTTDATGEFAGRFISINITLKSFDRLGKQVRGKKGSKHLALTLASVYHPCTKTGADDVYIRFLDTLDTILGKIPTENEIIMGADVNANIGRLDDLASTEFQSTLVLEEKASTSC